MSRSARHEFKDIFLASPTTFETDVSATSGYTLAAPGVGEYLEVWQIDVDGRASNAAVAGVEIRDGSAAANQIRLVQVGVGETKVITFGGLPKAFETAVWAQNAADSEAVRITVHYVPRKSRS
jgi:hypothetical protein